MKRLFIFWLVLLVGLAGCSGGEPALSDEDVEATVQARVQATQDAKPTDTPVPPTDTPIPPTDTPAPPTNTPTPEPPPTETPVPLSQDELEAQWEFPLGASLVLNLTCELTYEATGYGPGEIEAEAAFESISFISFFFEAINEELEIWVPTPRQEELAVRIEDHADGFTDLVNKWLEGEVSDDEVAAQIEEPCQDIAETLDMAVAEAKAAGLEDERIESYLASWMS